MEVLPINLKSNEMALQNAIFLPLTLAKDPNSTVHIKINDKLIKSRFTATIQKPNIGVSKVLRQYLKIDLVHAITIQPTQNLKQKDHGIKKIAFYISVRKNQDKVENLSVDRIKAFLRDRQTETVFNLEQPFYLKVDDVIYQLAAKQIIVGKKKVPYGLLVKQSEIQIMNMADITKSGNSTNKGSDDSSSGNSLFKPGFSASQMGIGGLDEEIFNIFRRTFASRRVDNEVVEKFGVKHVKGILLYGPPGTGKTLIARQLAKALNIKKDDLKIVNGPQIFSKYVGESQQNIRKLFSRARQDENKLGPKSPLHIIVFDEIDAICKQRGLYSGGGTNVNDQVVNQLLSNIDGVEALNNIVVIGMTNRKDLLDEAILRPGRFEVHIQVSLPNSQGRQQILKIHTSKLQQHSLLDKQCKMQQLARLTKNYTGAQIQALIKCASSFTITRCTNIMNFSQKLKIDEKNLKVKMQDFLKALDEVKPQFGVDQDKFNAYFREKLINYGGNYDYILNSLMEIGQVTQNTSGQIKSVLLYGPTGSGKTSIAVNYAKHCTFPYVKIIAPQLLIGQQNLAKIHFINKIFQDAYKTTRACIIIDNIERLVQYTAIGRRFSNQILQTLLTLISKIPPNSQTNLLIIGTTSMMSHMSHLDIPNSFHNKIYIPYLDQEQISRYLVQKMGQKYQSITDKIANKLINKANEKNKNKDKKGIGIRGLIEIMGLVSNYKDINEWQDCYGLLTDEGEQQDL